MKYLDNSQLRKEWEKLLIQENIKKGQVSAALGISPQHLHSFLKKQGFTFDDLARLLAPLGYSLHFDFIKNDDLSD